MIIFQKLFIRKVLLFTYFLSGSFIIHLINYRPPLQRFPNYDSFWIDSMVISKLNLMKNSFASLEVPQFNPFTQLGTELISEPQLYQNPFSPLNLFLLPFLSPGKLVELKSIIFLAIFAMGIFYLIKDRFNSTLTPTILSLLTLTIPVLSGSVMYYQPFQLLLYSVPLIYLLLFKFSQTHKFHLIVLVYMILQTIGLDLISSMVFFVIILSTIASEFVTKQIKRDAAKTSLIYLILFAISTFNFVYPFLTLYFESLSLSNLSDKSSINLFNYLHFFLMNGLHTFVFPFEGSVYNFYLPLFVYFGLLYIGYKLITLRLLITLSEKYLISFLFFLTLIPLVIYSIPFSAKLMPSYFRSSYTLVPIMLTILFLRLFNLVFSTVREKILLVLFSLSLELLIFVFNPFESFINDARIANVLNTSIPSPNVSSSSFLLREIVDSGFAFLAFVFMHFIYLLFILFNKFEAKDVFSKNKLIVLLLFGFVLLTSNFVTLESVRFFGSKNIQNIRSDFRLESFLSRYSLWANNFKIDNSQTRILIVGSKFNASKNVCELDGRSVRLLGDLELASLYNVRTTFQYREFLNPLISETYQSFFLSKRFEA